MTVYVFIGPTLTPEDVSSVVPDAVCLPPVAQGDVYRVARQRPRAIGIVDGYFSGAPSVWHKEILWALSQGIPVFGSASMGALRAAELHDFGMQGVGRIFEAYRDGELEDDDEVAVVHGPPETGFMVASEPMVNMRATLERAEAAGVISAPTRSQLESAAKSLFFPHRVWPNVLEAVVGDGLPDSERSKFEKWLPEGSVDRKREDALEMLVAMQATVADNSAHADFRFEQTHFWDDLVERVADEPTATESGMPDGLLDEVRLLGPAAYSAVMRNALARLLAERESLHRDFTPAPAAKAAVTTEHRADLGLYRRDQLDAWMVENELDQRSYDRLLEQETLLRQFTEASTAALAPYLLDELRMSGRFHQLFGRARDKAERVGVNSEKPPVIFQNTTQLRAWYFETRLEVPIPEDIGMVAVALGFESVTDFDRALRGEWLYTCLANGGPRSFDQESERRPSK